jgi:hypothetical protein
MKQFPHQRRRNNAHVYIRRAEVDDQVDSDGNRNIKITSLTIRQEEAMPITL